MLHYQPIVDLRDGRRVAVEALVRWQHPARGLLMPSAFVPLAEERGLSRSLDRWVMLAALRELVGYAGACLRDTGAPPERAVIEVAESALMHDRETASRVLEELKRLGMRVALDDFGSGHTALAYLKWLPVDEVKIDRSFVQGIGNDPRDEGVVRAIVAMSQGLRVDVVAEGVNDSAPARVAAEDWLLPDAGVWPWASGPARDVRSWLSVDPTPCPLPCSNPSGRRWSACRSTHCLCPPTRRV